MTSQNDTKMTITRKIIIEKSENWFLVLILVNTRLPLARPPLPLPPQKEPTITFIEHTFQNI